MQLVERYDAIYVRESSRKQIKQGYNIHTQEDLCRKFLEVKNDGREILEIKVYKEKGYSAKGMRRPVFNTLLKDVRDGKVRNIVVQKLDRFGRSTAGIFSMINEFLDVGTYLIALRENIDTSMPAWRVITSIFAAFAEEELYTISERTEESMTTAAKMGSYIKGGRAPFGTVRVRIQLSDDMHINRLNHHPEEWPLLLKIFDMAYRGYNCSVISRTISNEEYMLHIGKKLSEDTIEKILSNKIYCGIMKLKGKEYKIKFEDPLSLKYWKQVQINRRIHLKRNPKNEYKYNGKVFCECGTQCIVDVTNKQNSTGLKKYYYYVCPVCGKRINETAVAEAVEPKLNINYKKDTSNKVKELLKQKMNRAKTLKADLYKLFVNGKIKDSMYISEIERIEKDIEEMDRRVNNMSREYNKLSYKDKKLYLEMHVKKIIVSMQDKKIRLYLA